MSTDDRVTYRDPAMPGMTFGRPPTRPSRPRAVGGSDRDLPRVDGRGPATVDPGSAPVGRRDERTVEAASAEVDRGDGRTVELGSAPVDRRDERPVEPGHHGVKDPATEPDPAIPASSDDGVVAPVGTDPDAGDVDKSARTPVAGRPDDGPTLSTDQIAGLRRRWGAVQAGFVDDPRRAVEVADDILAEAVGALQAAIDDRRREVAEPWRDDVNASTDALIVAFQSYRSVFERVLSS